MEEVIFRHSLNVLNTGDHFTFHNRRAETIIDVTLCSNNLVDRVQDWEVRQEVVGSDHLLITFSFTISLVTSKVRNYNLGDWNLFQNFLDNRVSEPLADWSHVRLDRAAKCLESLIHGALNVSHPKRVLSNKVRSGGWWNKDLDDLSRKVRRAFTRARYWKSEECYNDLKQARKLLRKEIRRAKRQSWKTFCNEAKSVKEAALVNKIIKGGTTNSLGLLKTGDGSRSASPEESIKHLVDVHFPGSQAESKPDPRQEVITQVGKVTFITTSKVREAIGVLWGLQVTRTG